MDRPNLQILHAALTGEIETRLWEMVRGGFYQLSYYNEENRYRAHAYTRDELNLVDTRLADVLDAQLANKTLLPSSLITLTALSHWARKNYVISVEPKDSIYGRFGKRKELNNWFLDKVCNIDGNVNGELSFMLSLYVISRTKSRVEYIKEQRQTVLLRTADWLDPLVGSGKDYLASLDALDIPQIEWASHVQNLYLAKLVTPSGATLLPDGIELT